MKPKKDSPTDAVEKSLDFAIELGKANTNINNTLGILEKNPERGSTLHAILTSITTRVERHEYALKEIISSAMQYVTLNYDVEEICSVEGKVPRGDFWETDTKAIRDASSHAKYTISSNGEEIEFNNDEDGYSFNRKFTRKEFLQFYRRYENLANLQALLLRTAFLRSILVRYFQS